MATRVQISAGAYKKKYKDFITLIKMVTKTSKGWIRKEITGDGRESEKRWVERETNLRKPTKTKIKRKKKAEKELMKFVMNS